MDDAINQTTRSQKVKDYSIMKEGCKCKRDLYLVESVENQNRVQEPNVAAKDYEKENQW